jgi:ankyrin repeat protein
LPLHIACKNDGSVNIVKKFLVTYPGAVQVKNSYGRLPLHHVCDADVTRLLLDAYPEGAKVQDECGCLPLHFACIHGRSLKVLHMLLEAYPEGMDVREQSNKKPSFYLNCRAEFNFGGEKSFLLHNAITCRFLSNLVKFLLKAFPESCLTQDTNGMIPLHHACVSNASNFLDYVIALLDVDNTISLTLQDNQGRTPLQLLTHTSSTQDENKMLPLHRLVANSNTLSEQPLQLLIDIYPESITSPDKNGMLPFHHACLNEASSLEVLMLFVNFFSRGSILEGHRSEVECQETVINCNNHATIHYSILTVLPFSLFSVKENISNFDLLI